MLTRNRIAAILGLGAVLLLTGCIEPEPPKPVDKLAQMAEAAAQRAAAATVDPHEIKMIERRRTLMGKPGLQLYVVFLNDMGQPIEYFVTDGKCTSSGKRLTPGEQVVRGDGGSTYKYFVLPARSEDGTHGDSDEYIYCKTVDGKYKQWNGDYYVSDAPVELTIKPLVIDVAAPGEAGLQSQM